MGWEERRYFRDESGSFTNPVLRALNGSLPMFRAWGIPVRAHSTLIIFIAGMILLGSVKEGFPLPMRLVAAAIWMLVLILHGFGHFIVIRCLDGRVDEAILWPIGELIQADSTHRPMTTFAVAAGGPAVNVVLCAASATGLFFSTPTHIWIIGDSLTGLTHFYASYPYSDPALYFWWIYRVSFVIFLFNLLPFFPLDGAQMAHALFWPMIGNFRSIMMLSMAGMVGSVLGLIIALAATSWLIALVFLCTFYECFERRVALRESAPDEWPDVIDYHESIYGQSALPKRRRLNSSAIRKARRIARMETAARQRIDNILAKVSLSGIKSLNWWERRALRKTTESQRRRELEFSKFQ